MRRAKKKLILCVISFLLISTTLVFTTFERGQSGFSVFGKNFFAGNSSSEFDIDLLWTDDPTASEWNDVETTGNDIPFGSDILWEPDVSVVRYFKVKNSGNYDFMYNLGIDTPDPEISMFDYIAAHPIGDVIDVYLCNDINNLSSRSYLGTLNECFQTANILNENNGNDLSLESNSSKTCALVFTMKHSAGNEYQGIYDNSNNRLNNISFKISAGAYADEPDPEYDGEFGITLPNHENYLYRVGNVNNVKVSKLFYVNDTASANTNSLFSFVVSAADFDSSLLTFTSERIAGSSDVGFTFTAGTGSTAAEYLSSSVFKFKGTGVIKVTMLYNGQSKAELYLEVLSGYNITSENPTPNPNYNIIVLDNITWTGQNSVNNKRTLYGNGFTITSNRSSTSGTSGYLNINNGTVDNVILNGEVYDAAVTSGPTNQCYAPGVYIDGDANVYNSFISECKYAVSINKGNVILKNTTVTGGALANIYIAEANVTLENCNTSTTVRNGLKGLAIMVSNANASLTINGTLTQYNWLQKSDIPSDYQGFVSSVYNSSTFAYSTGGKTYVNMGIMFLNTSGNITSAQAQAAVSDNTSNTYSYTEQTYMGYKATLYTANASMGSQNMLSYPGYNPVDNGQYYTIPSQSFDYTTKNYIARVDGDNNYCYHDSTTGKINIGFDKTDSSTVFNWDPMIMTAQKYGSSISYTVSMNGTDYTNSVIPFAESGDYQVIYTYYDVNQYYYSDSSGLTNETVTYTQTVNIKVTAVEPETVSYNAIFNYVSTWANSAKKVIINNNTYVMPDVTATSSTIGSTTVGGQTVYFPIVTVGPTSSNGNTTYSSGKGYYFAPVFNAINITDLNQDTGAEQYTYTSSSTTWPHGKAQANGPDTSIFSYANGAAYANQPYARPMNSQYYGFGKNNNGLCYTSNEIEKNNDASTHLVQYHYVSNDGTTYYYYIQYSFTAMTYKSGGCFASGTMITLDDGNQKPIEKLTFADRIMSYNLFTGKIEAQDISSIVNHGEDFYSVVNLIFKDGTVLRIIADHGLFDYTLNKFVFIDKYNYNDYIGHKFVKLKDNGKFKKVKLVDVFVTNEYTTAYSTSSAYNINAFAQNLLTLSPPGEFTNWIDMGGKMRYDKQKFDADVRKYGLYDYSLFEDYISYEAFDTLNFAYTKAAVEEGKLTFDYLIDFVKLYGSYMK